MATQGESLVRKTQKGLSVLAFETTKQGRILKKRMRVAALQKEVRADLRDLGSLVYNALVNDQTGILEEEEIKLLVESIQRNKAEIEHLRDAIARISRVRKHFEEGDQAGDPAAAMAEPQAETTPAPAEPPEAGEEAAKEAAGAEAAAPEAEAPKPKRAPRKRSTSRTTKKAEDEAADDGPKKSAPRKRAPRKKKAEPAVPPAPGTDPDHPEPPPSGDGDKS